jgi:hypothetical protein
MDCADPLELGSFWAALLGGEVAFTSDNFVAVKLEHLWLSAVHLDDYRAPTWPEGDLPKEIHFDLAVDDLATGEAEVLALGGVKAATQPAPERFLVFLDPAGHPFCLSTMIPE